MSDKTRGRLAGKSQGAASASEPPEVRDALTAPPVRSRDDAEKAIAAVLRKHHLFGEGPAGEVTCYCSERFANRQDHRTHVASVLADLMADAWDEGAKTLDEFHHHRRKVPGPMPPPNPYRVTDTEGDR